eukprot:6468989-Amphidinium_carterae.1
MVQARHPARWNIWFAGVREQLTVSFVAHHVAVGSPASASQGGAVLHPAEADPEKLASQTRSWHAPCCQLDLLRH